MNDIRASLFPQEQEAVQGIGQQLADAGVTLGHTGPLDYKEGRNDAIAEGIISPRGQVIAVSESVYAYVTGQKWEGDPQDLRHETYEALQKSAHGQDEADRYDAFCEKHDPSGAVRDQEPSQTTNDIQTSLSPQDQAAAQDAGQKLADAGVTTAPDEPEVSPSL